MRLTVRVYRWIKAEIRDALEHVVWLIDDIRNPGSDTDPGTPLPDPNRTLKAKTSGSYADRMRKS